MRFSEIANHRRSEASPVECTVRVRAASALRVKNLLERRAGTRLLSYSIDDAGSASLTFAVTDSDGEYDDWDDD